MKITNSFPVISNYNNDLSWVPEFAENYVIYNKMGEIHSSIKQDSVVQGSPLGMAAHEFLSYIVTNYDNLPNLVMFIKGNIFPRHVSREFFETICNNNFFTPIEDYRLNETSYPRSLQACEGGFMEYNDSWYSMIHPHKHFADYGALLRFVYKDPVIPIFIRFAPGGCYIVSKEQIRKLPKSTYEKLKGFVAYDQNPAEAHIIERMFYTFWNSNMELK